VASLLHVAGAIETLDDCARRPHDCRIESRDAQAAFLLELHAITLDEFRVDEDHQCRRVVADRDIDDEDAQRLTHLRSRQPDPGGRIHGFDHVVDEPFDLRRDGLDGPGRIVENPIAVFQIGQHSDTTINASPLSAEIFSFRKTVDDSFRVADEPLH
jgi:hypothetical protein